MSVCVYVDVCVCMCVFVLPGRNGERKDRDDDLRKEIAVLHVEAVLSVISVAAISVLGKDSVEGDMEGTEDREQNRE